ncbi:hypothetical protein [Pyramidobacter sp. C12-8]|uniref:hypothetical protein n=1 Tax=Pyramidobacter sp. C12-8 TaxID=1943580 RepID=UPI00098F1B8A|nr:hypothetical protein [Pyramidobacter sp. C12-8]OON89112.1 hypothetical protein B0D78_05785 [Pyramidobacter sp. C12-8]
MNRLHVIPIAMLHGVAVYPDGKGGLTAKAMFKPLAPDGVAYLKRHKVEIIETYKEYSIDEIMSVFLRTYSPEDRAEMIDEYRERVAIMTEGRPVTLAGQVQAWAVVIGSILDGARPWPED